MRPSTARTRPMARDKWGSGPRGPHGPRGPIDWRRYVGAGSGRAGRDEGIDRVTRSCLAWSRAAQVELRELCGRWAGQQKIGEELNNALRPKLGEPPKPQ